MIYVAKLLSQKQIVIPHILSSCDIQCLLFYNDRTDIHYDEMENNISRKYGTIKICRIILYLPYMQTYFSLNDKDTSFEQWYIL